MIDLTSAHWHPLYVDDGKVTFIHVIKKHCTGGHQMIFERRVGNDENPTTVIDYDDIPTLPFNPAIYIMHIAYGGSTLLTRMFTECGGFVAYMEPMLHSIFHDDPKIPQLYTRSFGDDIPVIKPLQKKWICLINTMKGILIINSFYFTNHSRVF